MTLTTCPLGPCQLDLAGPCLKHAGVERWYWRNLLADAPAGLDGVGTDGRAREAEVPSEPRREAMGRWVRVVRWKMRLFSGPTKWAKTAW